MVSFALLTEISSGYEVGLKKETEAYLQPCQTSKMELVRKIVNG